MDQPEITHPAIFCFFKFPASHQQYSDRSPGCQSLGRSKSKYCERRCSLNRVWWIHLCTVFMVRDDSSYHMSMGLSEQLRLFLGRRSGPLGIIRMVLVRTVRIVGLFKFNKLFYFEVWDKMDNEYIILKSPTFTDSRVLGWRIPCWRVSTVSTRHFIILHRHTHEFWPRFRLWISSICAAAPDMFWEIIHRWMKFTIVYFNFWNGMCFGMDISEIMEDRKIAMKIATIAIEIMDEICFRFPPGQR